MAKSILFNTEMVQAILEGRKTVTRRIAKRVIAFDEEKELFNFCKNNGEWIGATSKDDIIKDYAPYQVGDILYVRETWKPTQIGDNYFVFKYKADGMKSETIFIDSERYEIIRKYFEKTKNHPGKFVPSIHMPKEAARIFLKVTDVRVERLKKVSPEQIEKEGVIIPNGFCYEDLFANLWNSTIKKQDLGRYGWDTNPWVWVIEFERLSQ